VDLVSSDSGSAAHVDADLRNPWGLVQLANGVLWIADNHSGVSTAYGPKGAPLGLRITIPPAKEGNPTGVAFNSTPHGFQIPKTKVPARLLFVSEDGSISAWHPDVDRAAAVTVRSEKDAIFKGLALGDGRNGPLLYVANFHAGRVEVFDRNFDPKDLKHGFEDPNLPDGYAPFNIANVGGRLVVTYAKQDADAEDDAPGAGFGFVDVYDFQGRLLRRFASGGTLNAPWGVALAPQDFGRFGGALLIGNFGDGRINAFDWKSGRFLGALSNDQGNPIQIEGLWGLEFSLRSRDGDRDDDDGHHDGDRGDAKHGDGERTDGSSVLYFTAGPNGEEDGLFGVITAVGRGKDRDPHSLANAASTELAPALQEFSVSALGGNPVRLSSGNGVSFRMTLPQPSIVRLGIFDVSGRLVAEPLRNREVTGTIAVRWDGVDARGLRVAPGTYFYRAVTGAKVSSGRVVLVP
jgi:uncharacterized protein (TIGR03118 family)